MKSLVKKKVIRKILTDCAYDDSVPWIRFAADATTEYQLRRAAELLYEVLCGESNEKLSQAITLLALARYKNYEENKT